MSEHQQNEQRHAQILVRCRMIIKCDTARISQPGERMFLVIGFNRNTKDDKGQWMKDGIPYDFYYVAERVVASGETEEELIASVQEYKRLCCLPIEKDAHVRRRNESDD